MFKKLEKWSGILGLLLGVVAILLAWQANNIAKKQSVPNVMLISESGSGGGGGVGNSEGGMDWYCLGRAQLANLGGVSTSIIGFSGKLSFLDEEIELSAYKSYWIRSRNETLFNEYLHSFNVTIEPVEPGQSWPDYDPINTYPYPEITMPIEIDANSSVYLLFIVRYVADSPLDPHFTYQSDKYPDLRKFPMQAEYHVNFSDGKSLLIPKTDCQWFLP